jgi:hypothetical protein
LLVEYTLRTKTTKTPADRAAANKVGSRDAVFCTSEISNPSFAIIPPDAQKSFCISTTISAVCFGSIFSRKVAGGRTCDRRAAISKSSLGLLKVESPVDHSGCGSGGGHCRCDEFGCDRRLINRDAEWTQSVGNGIRNRCRRVDRAAFAHSLEASQAQR